MDEFTADAFANRQEPVPFIAGMSNNEADSDSESAKQNKQKKSTKSSLQDRLFAKILQQVIPGEDLTNVFETQTADRGSSKYASRPGFSLPLMTNNFRRFNARIGVIFVFQNRLIRLLSWKTPAHTLSLLAVSTFVCLNPSLLAVLPLAVSLLFVMVPAYLVRYPPPPSITQAPRYSIHGPPLAPPGVVRPASETSKDFFRNMRDLQNTMQDFTTAHDLILKTFTPPTNFSDEPLSSTIFQFLFLSSCVLFISSHLLPWRLLSLVICWTGIVLGHPSVQEFIRDNCKEHIEPRQRAAQSWFDRWIAQDIILDEAPETRDVEIFELQRRKGGNNGEWESWIFSPSPYDPLSPQRISGDRPRGTRFFEDVEPPAGWEWGDKKWVLDLASKDWVEERMVQGVEVEIESERWVVDFVTDADGTDSDEKAASGGSTEKKPYWEKSIKSHPAGQWRRRRWIRTVRRKFVGSQDDKRES